jgi:hypothetical protein
MKAPQIIKRTRRRLVTGDAMGMPPIEMHLSLFNESDGGLSRGRSQKVILWMMEALTRANQQLLEQYGDEIPLLYAAPVRYEAEADEEQWQDIRHILKSGSGDCEDLACWRTAELRVKAGLNAGPYIKWRRGPEGNMIYHALTRWPDGRIEDPSLALGMHGEMLRRPTFVEP